MGAVVHLKYRYDLDQKPRPIRFGAEYDEHWRSPHQNYFERGEPLPVVRKPSATAAVLTIVVSTAAWVALSWLALRMF